MDLLRLFREKFPMESIELREGSRFYVNGEDTKVDWKSAVKSYKSLTNKDRGKWIWMNCELMESFLSLRRLGIK